MPAKRSWVAPVKIYMTEAATRPGTIQLLGQSLDLRANAAQAWQLHRPFIWLLLFTVVLDALSTMAFMSTLGVGHEQNPFIRQLAHGLGIVGGTSLGKLGQVFAVAGFVALTPRLARMVFTVVILLNLFAFVVNMRVFILSV